MQSAEHSPSSHLPAGPTPHLPAGLAAIVVRLSALTATFGEGAQRARIGEHSALVTILALIGAGSGLCIAALLSRDPREAGAYAVACVMIGGAMAVGVRTRNARIAAGEPQSCPAQREMESVAHDLKAPLLSISSYLDLVASGAFGNISDEAAHALRRASQLSERAQAVVATALPRTSEAPAPARAIPLGRTISEVATALTPALRERDASLTVEGVLPLVNGDDVALFRVFENLVQNAIKYCPEGRTPHVTVNARRIDGRTIEVVVADNGDGMPGDANALARHGARGTNAAGVPGYGLGLATVARLVSRMDGTLTLEPGAEGGTRARITLPAA